jgi:hypothetical protein
VRLDSVRQGKTDFISRERDMTLTTEKIDNYLFEKTEEQTTLSKPLFQDKKKDKALDVENLIRAETAYETLLMEVEITLQKLNELREAFLLEYGEGMFIYKEYVINTIRDPNKGSPEISIHKAKTIYRSMHY